MKRALAVMLSTAIIFSGFIPAFAFKSAAVNGCNWMSVIKDDVSVADLSIPGTHDSASQNISFAVKSRCQSQSIPEQLNDGARFLDIRLAEDKGKLILVHGITNCRKGSGFGSPKIFLDEVINECLEFLKNNPKETILFFVKKERGKDDGFHKLFMKYVSKEKEKWYLKNSIPDLGEVRGKIVLLNRFSQQNALLNDFDAGLNLTDFPKQDKKGGAFQAVPLKSFSTGSEYSIYTVQDRYKYSKTDKWEKAVKPTLEIKKIDGALLICFLSTASGISPKISSDYVNGRFMDYKTESNKSYGVILFDFFNSSLAQKVYSCNSRFIDNSVLPETGTASAAPQKINGKIPFMSWLWNFIIKVFS